MASNNSWIADTVGDFIHSPVWTAPIHTFIEAYCAAFDYDDDDDDDTTNENDTVPSSSVEEQTNIHEQYQRLVDSLIIGLGQDLSLDQNELNQACQLPTTIDDSVVIDESHEQLYSARDFQLFQEMMRRKNLILQLQALVSLQLQWGLLKPSDGGDDLVLSLLLQATTASSSSRRSSFNPPSEPVEEYVEKQQIERPVKQQPIQEKDDDDDDDVVVVQKKQSPRPTHKKKERIEPRKPPKEEHRLPSLRQKGGSELNADWYRELRAKNQQRDEDETEDDQSKKASTPQTIGAISEQVLREKLRELTVRTASVDDETVAAMKSRKDFLQQQRDLILSKQRAEREQDLIQQTHNTRPQSAVHVARKAMATSNKSDDKKTDETPTQIPNEELIKRRVMMEKLKRNVVDKH